MREIARGRSRTVMAEVIARSARGRGIEYLGCRDQGVVYFMGDVEGVGIGL